MLVEFDFAVIQLRYIHAAMSLIASYRPDGLEPTDVLTLISSADPTRAVYVTEKVAIDGSRAERRVKMDLLHEHCVDFHAQAKSRFRNDEVIRQRLERQPVEDRNFQETLTRGLAISKLWEALPLVGTPPAAFTVGRGTGAAVTRAQFDTLLGEARTLDSGIALADELFQQKEAALHKKQKEMEDVAGAALAQGNSQFDEGTAEREMIDAIPTESPRNLPGKAVISDSGSPATGVAHLDYDCDGATTFDIYHKAPGETEFGKHEEDRLEKTIDIISLDPGTHEFYVRGRNARGLGEESETVSVEVMA